MDRRISDLEINNLVRRELVTRRVDTSRVKFGSTGGVVRITGLLKFSGPAVSPQEVPKFLHQLERAIKGLQGVKACKMDFDTWERNQAGKWVEKAKSGMDLAKEREERLALHKKNQAPVVKEPEKPKLDKEILKQIEPRKCPKCLYDLTRGYLFCENCGESIKLKIVDTLQKKCPSCNYRTMNPAYDECPNCNEKLERESVIYFTVRCSKCGHTKNKMQGFCPDCGKNLSKKEYKSGPINVKTREDIMSMIEDSEQDAVESPAVEEEEEKPRTIKDRVRELLEQEREKKITGKNESDKPEDPDDIFKDWI